MLALIETETYRLTPSEKLNGIFKNKTELFYSEDKLLNMDILRVKMRLPTNASGRKTEHSFETLFEFLSRAEAYRVCLSDGFFMSERFSDCGFILPGEDILWRKKAWELAELSAKSKSRALVLPGESFDGAFDTCEKLSKSFRNVAVLSDRKISSDCRKMCEKTGISIVEKPSFQEQSRANAIISFENDKKLTAKEDCIVIGDGKKPQNIMGGGFVSSCDFLYSGGEKIEFPVGFARNPILSELVRTGKCAESDISVSNIVTTHN